MIVKIFRVRLAEGRLVFIADRVGIESGYVIVEDRGGGEHANVAGEFKLGRRKEYVIVEGGSAGEGGIGCRPGVGALVRAGRGILILELNPAGVVMGCGGG